MDNRLSRNMRTACTALLLTTALPVWAQDAATDTPDPYEGINRAVFAFNDKADTYVLQPVARGYRKITPKPVRTAVGNFFDNFRDVNSFASNLLRGNVKNAGYDFMRVAVNTTFGLGGLINIADEAGMPNNKNTLGDTFASWGWKNSNYLVVPLAGPSTVRDTLGSAISTVYSVEGGLVLRDEAVRYPLAALNVVDRREGLLDTTDTLDQMALDKYIVTRDAYMALRNKQLGNPLPEQPELFDPEADAATAANASAPTIATETEDTAAVLPPPVETVGTTEETEEAAVSAETAAADAAHERILTPAADRP